MIVDAYIDIFDLGIDAALGKNFDPASLPDCRAKFWPKLDEFLTFLEPYCAKGQWLNGPKICISDFWVGSMVFSFFKNPESFGHGNDGPETFEKRLEKSPPPKMDFDTTTKPEGTFNAKVNQR